MPVCGGRDCSLSSRTQATSIRIQHGGARSSMKALDREFLLTYLSFCSVRFTDVWAALGPYARARVSCMYVYASMYMYVYVCLCMSMYVYVCICTYMYVCMYVCICMYIYVYVYVCMYECMVVCMYVICMCTCAGKHGEMDINFIIIVCLHPSSRVHVRICMVYDLHLGCGCSHV